MFPYNWEMKGKSPPDAGLVRLMRTGEREFCTRFGEFLGFVSKRRKAGSLHRFVPDSLIHRLSEVGRSRPQHENCSGRRFFSFSVSRRRFRIAGTVISKSKSQRNKTDRPVGDGARIHNRHRKDAIAHPNRGK